MNSKWIPNPFFFATSVITGNFDPNIINYATQAGKIATIS